MAALRLGVLASGRGSNLHALLEASEKNLLKSRVTVVVSDVEDAQALERARAKNVEAHAIPPPGMPKGPERRKAHEDSILKMLRKHRVDLVVLAGYMRILGHVLVGAYPHKIINIHPSLLPSFPGIEAQRQAIEWGARVAGASTHFVDEQVDHGPIILQAAVAVRGDDAYDSLAKRILAVEHQLLPRTVSLIEDGRVHLEGRRVRIDQGPSWKTRVPVLPDVLYSEGY